MPSRHSKYKPQTQFSSDQKNDSFQVKSHQAIKYQTWNDYAPIDIQGSYQQPNTVNSAPSKFPISAKSHVHKHSISKQERKQILAEVFS